MLTCSHDFPLIFNYLCLLLAWFDFIFGLAYMVCRAFFTVFLISSRLLFWVSCFLNSFLCVCVCVVPSISRSRPSSFVILFSLLHSVCHSFSTHYYRNVLFRQHSRFSHHCPVLPFLTSCKNYEGNISPLLLPAQLRVRNPACVASL